MKCDDYSKLLANPFVETLFKEALVIQREITEPSGFKSKDTYKRVPTELEHYCLRLGFCLSHFLTVVQQMEHTLLYMSNFSPSKKMTNAGVNRATHLLWSVENYIIRTQTVYDRLLVLVDGLFNLQNNPLRISHESIVTNLHIRRSKIPAALKKLKKAVGEYYFDRNAIIHEYAYMDDDLRRIEGYSILASDPMYGVSDQPHWKEEIRYSVKQYVARKCGEFTRINQKICIATGDIFDVCLPIYEKQKVKLK